MSILFDIYTIWYLFYLIFILFDIYTFWYSYYLIFILFDIYSFLYLYTFIYWEILSLCVSAAFNREMRKGEEPGEPWLAVDNFGSFIIFTNTHTHTHTSIYTMTQIHNVSDTNTLAHTHIFFWDFCWISVRKRWHLWL